MPSRPPPAIRLAAAAAALALALATGCSAPAPDPGPSRDASPSPARTGDALVPDHDPARPPKDGPRIGWKLPEVDWVLLSRQRLGGARRGTGAEIRAAGDVFEIGGYTGRRPDPADALALIPALREAVGLYPPGFLDELGVQRFVFVAGLGRGDVGLGGLAVTSTGSILIDVGGRRAIGKTLHHELMHFIDAATAPRRDRRWIGLNPPGARYGGRRGAKARGDLDGRLTIHHPGFLTRYSLVSAREDKAEVFAWLMSKPHEVAEQALVDRVIAAKVDYVRAQARAADPRLDDRWWEAVWERGRIERDAEAAVRRRRRPR